MFKPARKKAVKQLSSRYYLVNFELLEPLSRRPRPLQFINIWIPGVDEVPMSIALYNGEESLSVIFKVVGEGTKALRDVSGYFGIKGPLGKGLDFVGLKRALFVAGGTGIAPLPYTVEYASLEGVVVDLVWGVRSSDMLFNIRDLAPRLGEVYYATEDCGTGFCGTATQLALKLVRENPSKWDMVISVGPNSMLRELCREVRELVELRISLESIVKCGLGACGSCTLKPTPKLLCLDGPVFSCSEVIEYLEKAP